MMSRTLLAVAISLGLSACVSVLPDPKPANIVYRFSSDVQAVQKLSTAEAIRVDRPDANQVLSSNDIVVSVDGRTLSVISQAKWAETAPDMIQSSMVNTLSGSPNFIGLVPISGARTDTRLHLSVMNFEADFDKGRQQAPLAIVSYRVTYARADNRNLIGTYLVRKTQRANSINVSSIVAAIETASDAAMKDIVTWLETQQPSGAF